MLIYVSCPYSAETHARREFNTQRAIAGGIRIMLKGHSPLIPNLMHYVDEYAKTQNIDFTWDDFMKVDLELLERCDGILYMGSSPGCDLELEHARKNGLKVFYSAEEIDEE